MAKNISKHDDCVKNLKDREFISYVDSDRLTVGVYCTTEDMIKANKNVFLKKLKNRLKYKIQMVIK